MIILIAESKTMAPCTEPVSDAGAERTPVFVDEACAIMRGVADRAASDLSRLLKISAPLAARLKTMAYEFPNAALGRSAIEAFTGVVFRALDYASLSEAAVRRADGRVRIVSSAYGWLRPRDVVKPYRLDFTPKLAPDGAPLAAFWRHGVTDELCAMLAGEKVPLLVDLLPGDAARCIDWKREALKGKVIKVEFRVEAGGGAMRTPDSSRLKILRGLLLRQMLEENVDTPEHLASLESDHYMPCPELPEPGRVVFVTA